MDIELFPKRTALEDKILYLTNGSKLFVDTAFPSCPEQPSGTYVKKAKLVKLVPSEIANQIQGKFHHS